MVNYCALDCTSFSSISSSFFSLFVYLDLIISDKNGFVNRYFENIFKYFNPSYFPQIPYAILFFILFYIYSKTSQDAIIILNNHYSFIIFIFIYSDIYLFVLFIPSIFPFFHLGLFSYCMRNSLSYTF